MTKHDDPTPEKFDLRSLDLAAEKRAELLRLFPECATEGGKVDFDRLKAALGEQIDAGKERYGLTWPGKAACFQTIQRPSLATLRPKVDESVEFDTTQNVIIEGDNLEVLKLLQKSYLGKVKMIYIDPPYNTGNDFIYPDNYTESLQTYLEYTGQVDGEGRKFSSNTEADGRFHSKWLNMMYPRLYLARNLLREDGVIMVSIDDHEVENLRRVLDEVFGEESFVGCVARVAKKTSNKGTHFAPSKDYVVVYARSITQLPPLMDAIDEEYAAKFKGRDDVGQFATVGLYQAALDPRPNQRYWIECPDGTFAIPPGDVFPTDLRDGAHIRPVTDRDRVWRWSYESYLERKRLLVFKRTTTSPLLAPDKSRSAWNVYTKYYLDDRIEDGVRPRDYLDDLTNEKGTADLKALGLDEQFPFAKPVALVQLLMTWAHSRDAIVLDFFAGSGTTAHAVLEQNKKDGGSRQFVLVQLPEPTGRADYPTIADITKERVRRVVKNLNDADKGQLRSANEPKPDRGFRVFQLASSNFKPWDGDQAKDPAGLQRQLFDHVEHVLSDRSEQDLLYEILLKDGFELTTPVATFEVRGFRVHSVANGELLLCLQDKLTHELIQDLAERRPSRVVFLDRGFRGNDQLKTNAAKLFASKAGEGFKKFKTV